MRRIGTELAELPAARALLAGRRRQLELDDAVACFAVGTLGGVKRELRNNQSFAKIISERAQSIVQARHHDET